MDEDLKRLLQDQSCDYAEVQLDELAQNDEKHINEIEMKDLDLSKVEEAPNENHHEVIEEFQQTEKVATIKAKQPSEVVVCTSQSKTSLKTKNGHNKENRRTSNIRSNYTKSATRK